MKNKIKNMALRLLCLLGFVFSLVSCAEVDEEVGNKPALEPKGNAIIVSFAVEEKAKYVNIFRREVIDGDPVTYGEIKNIGQVIPIKNQETAFTFTDTFFCKGVSYQYRVRYCMGNYYYFSNWSDAKKNVSDECLFFDEADIAYKVPVDCHFEYNSETSSLTLKGGNIPKIAEPEILEKADVEGMYAALVFSYKDGNATHSKVFALEDETSDITDGTIIDLRSLLTSDFFSKDITLNYILGEKVLEGGPDEDEDGDGKIDNVYYEKVVWSMPTAVVLKNELGEELPSIKIDVKMADNGHDYSFEGIESGVTENINTITSKNAPKEFFIF